MSVHNALTAFYLGEDGQALVDLTPALTSLSWQQRTPPYDVTPIGFTHRAYLAGITEATLVLEGLWSPTVGAALQHFAECERLTFVYGPAGTATGRPRYTGHAVVARYRVMTAPTGLLTFLLELQVTETVTLDTFP